MVLETRVMQKVEERIKRRVVVHGGGRVGEDGGT